MEGDDDMPSGVSINDGGYFVGRPVNYTPDIAIGLGGYFIGRPQAVNSIEDDQPTRFLKLAREKLAAALDKVATAMVPLELRSELIKEMDNIITGSRKHVDRGLLETMCREISDMADELQANKEPSVCISLLQVLLLLHDSPL